MTGTLYDAAATRAVIPKSAVSTITLTLTNAATGNVINSRSAQNVLDANDCSMDATSGAFLWNIQALDTTLEVSTADAEEHNADFTVTGTFIGSPLEFRHRIRCMEMLLLTRFEDVALYVKDIDTSEEPLVNLLIEAFTKRAENFCRRTFRKSTVANPTVDVFSPPGIQPDSTYSTWSTARVSRWPVDSIVSVKESLDGGFTGVDSYDATEYAIGPEGIVRMRWRPFLNGVASLEIKSVGGLARDTGAVPGDLRSAATRQVAAWWQRRTDLGVSGMNNPNGGVTLYQSADLLPDVKAVLRLYCPRVPSFG